MSKFIRLAIHEGFARSFRIVRVHPSKLGFARSFRIVRVHPSTLVIVLFFFEFFFSTKHILFKHKCFRESPFSTTYVSLLKKMLSVLSFLIGYVEFHPLLICIIISLNVFTTHNLIDDFFFFGSIGIEENFMSPMILMDFFLSSPHEGGDIINTL